MAYLYSFLIAGGACLIAQIIFDKTKLTPGHIVSIFVIIGVVLSFCNVYDLILDIAPGGGSILITNYGHLLYSSGLKGLKENNNLLNGIMTLMASSSATLAFAIFMGFLCSLVKGHE